MNCLESISLHYVSPPSLAMPKQIMELVDKAGISQVTSCFFGERRLRLIGFELEMPYKFG